MKSGIQFVAADMPFADSLTIHIIAAMAEHERKMISARTKAALAEVKRRGEKKLGNPRWQDTIAKARAARNPDPAPQVVEMIQDGRARGVTLRAIADQLNGIGVPTARGNRWHPETIRTTLNRAAQQQEQAQ